jgi:hypothetical protein
MDARPGVGCALKIHRTSGFVGRSIARGDVPDELRTLQGLAAWDGLRIFPDAQPEPDGHWQFPRISAGWEAAGRDTLSSATRPPTRAPSLSRRRRCCRRLRSTSNSEVWPKNCGPRNCLCPTTSLAVDRQAIQDVKFDSQQFESAHKNAPVHRTKARVPMTALGESSHPRRSRRTAAMSLELPPGKSRYAHHRLRATSQLTTSSTSSTSSRA